MTLPMIALSVLPCCDILATKGVCEGEEMSFAAELSLDDIYRVTPGCQMTSLVLHPDGDAYRISPVSAAGTAGAEIRLDAEVTLASTDGALLRALLLVELSDGLVQSIYLHPKGQMSSGLDYRLIEISAPGNGLPVSDPAATAIHADTMIICAEGPRRAGDLIAGDLVMTQTDGLKPVEQTRHILVEATGDTAPVVVRAGLVGNSDPLILGRARRVRLGRSAALQPLAALMDGQDIRAAQGGHLPMVDLVLPGAPVILTGGAATDAGGVAPLGQAIPARATKETVPLVRLTGIISG